jgi:hypothetical protein
MTKRITALYKRDLYQQQISSYNTNQTEQEGYEENNKVFECYR